MAIDSILNQTYRNFVYYVLDNGSTDRTGEIIREYAARDERVRFLRNEKNDFNIFHSISVIINESVNENCDYFCQLDADDEYMPDFLKRSLAFALAKDLDIVCCGNDFVDAVTGKITSKRMVGNDVILDRKSFEYSLEDCFQFCSTVWAHLFRLSVINSMDLKGLASQNLTNGSDTVFTCTAFQKTDKIEVMKGTVLRYYQYPASVISTYYPSRFKSNLYVFKTLCELIINKCGQISPQNKKVSYEVYLTVISDTQKVLLPSRLSAAEKISKLHEIYTQQETITLIIAVNRVKQGDMVYGATVKWLLSQSEAFDAETAQQVNDILAVTANGLSRA